MICYRWMPHDRRCVFLVVEPGRESIAKVFMVGVAWGWMIGTPEQLSAVGLVEAEHSGTADTAVAAGKRVMEILRHAGEAIDHSNSAFRRLCHLQDADDPERLK